MVSIGRAWRKAEEAVAAGSTTTTVRTVSGRLAVRRGPPPEIAAEAEAPAMAGLRSHVVGRKLAPGIKDAW